MSRYGTPRTIPLALVLIIVAVGIAALVSITRAIFFSGGQTTSQQDLSQQSLLDTAANHSVSMTIRGPIVANENFHTSVVTVAPSSRLLVVSTGYEDQQITQQVALGNNIPAYQQFVYALDKANLVKGTEQIGAANDTRGICATGQLYQFSVLVGGKSVKTLWTSTCSGSPGSLDASYKQLSNLFLVQIPNGSSLISSVSL
jgi:hypothetical protein